MAEHMLILGVEDPHGEKTYVAAAFPSACGKTNLAMLIPPTAMQRLEGLDRRRRHRLDQAGRRRPAAGDQPGGRLLRRRAGHVARRPTRTRWRRSRRNTIFTNVALTPDGGVWWEGHDRRAARRMPRLAGAAAGRRRSARDTGKPAAHPNARFTAPAAQCPIIDPGLGTTRRACRSARSSSAAAAPRPCRWSIRRSTGPPASTSARRWARRRRRRRPARSARCAAIRWRCCRSAAITWATTSGTGSRCSASLQRDAEDLPRQLVPQGRRGPVPVARVPREHARAEVDRRPRARPRAGARRRRSAGCRATRTSTGAGCDFPKDDVRRAPGGRPGAVAARSDRPRGALHRAARPSAAGDDLRARAADLQAVGSRRVEGSRGPADPSNR